MATVERYLVYRCDQPLLHRAGCDGVLDAKRDQCSSCKRAVWINPDHAAGRLVICWDCGEPECEKAA